MNDTDKIIAMLDELEMKYEQGSVDESMEFFEIALDESEGLNATGLLYETDEGPAFRLLAFMDELDDSNPLEQLSLLMALNGEIPVGAFCMDPEEQVVYSTVNLPLDDLNPELLSWLLEYVFAVQNLYFQEYGLLDEGEN